MNALAGIRPARYTAKTYAAFRLRDSGKADKLAFTAAPASLQDALNAVLPGCIHKDRIAVRERDAETGAVLLHVYVIKRRAPQWVQPAGEIVPRRVADLYAEAVCVIDGGVLA